ncbi:hypothetical protein CQ10_41015 [Bradyrhizobium valentinum]|uniref:DUF3313 domain-containing protein n=2 Tax=Bradyrhizobium valentinum TaxID=1518501 RepID=A0A0R3LY57_9BRAD|nr:hypothetical protein CP49_14195 [Bradyrhizobium valentinum]KRR10051.1 hypothetical protein CQ10_41015 [Bradyrhizobium valentinum]
MRSAATINLSRSYETFPFYRPCRVRYRVSRLIRLPRRRCFSSTYQQLPGVMAALMLVAAIRLAPFAGGGSAAPLVQVLFAARPSRSPSKREQGCEIGRCSVSRYRPWNGIEARRPHYSMFLAMLAIVSLLPGCATAPLVQGGGLSSYDGLKPSDGKVTKSRLVVKKEQLAAAKTLNIAPTAFPPHVAPTLSNEQRGLVANAVSRALCVSLSDRYKVVTPDVPADITVRAAVTRATETDEVAAGISAATSIGVSFVDTSVPIPVPRIPIGLGDLSIEAEAVDRSGKQQAAMVWGRGATAFFSTPRASKASDAYDLAGAFGDDFANLLNKGESPFEGVGIDIPSWDKIGSKMGLAPKYAACENYGRAPGIAGLVGGKLGLPPEWTDDGPKVARKP